MDNAKQQIVERLKQANNILITVSRNPSVDQLSAAIGFALFLNKLNKHASAVFSGTTPSVLEFLEPQKTLEKNTDSLRDFIISLDKSKADKLRYKVENEHVKIFITPYRTSISDADLEFSQGDFNVDVVIAVGVQQQQDLDQAITAHGRILHDATVIAVSKTPGANLGALNWVDEQASSLCEMLAELSDVLQANSFDTQIATALLTGIVAETGRFSNDKTTSVTMSVSSKLLAAGANQKLVAENLQPKPVAPPPPPPVSAIQPDMSPVGGSSQQLAAESNIIDGKPGEPGLSLPPVQTAPSSDGSLMIDHTAARDSVPEDTPEPEEEQLGQIHINDQGELTPVENSVLSPGARVADPSNTDPSRHLLSDQPLTTPPKDGEDRSVTDPLAFIATPVSDDTVGGFADPTLEPPKLAADQPPVPDTAQHDDAQTLSDLEAAVSSPHVKPLDIPLPVPTSAPVPDLNTAREAVDSVVASTEQVLPPITALNASPVNINLPSNQPAFATPVLPQEPGMTPPPMTTDLPNMTSDFSFPDHLIQPSAPPAGFPDPNLPPAPPVPPPMMPGANGLPFLPGLDNNPSDQNRP